MIMKSSPEGVSLVRLPLLYLLGTIFGFNILNVQTWVISSNCFIKNDFLTLYITVYSKDTGP
mgnify:CR=1 FL=1